MAALRRRAEMVAESRRALALRQNRSCGECNQTLSEGSCIKKSSKAASVNDRLLVDARASGSDFSLILSHSVLERFLYRFSASHYKERHDTPSRPSRDADVFGFDTLDEESMSAIPREICAIECDNGMHYLMDNPPPIIKAYPKETVMRNVLGLPDRWR